MAESRPSPDGDAEERGPFVRRGEKPVASSAEGNGPEEAGPWGWTGGINDPAPWGVAQDSPMDEGSEPTAVTEGRRGERRAGFPAPPDEKTGRHGFGPVEPSRAREAGPGGPPDPAPHRRTFPEPVSNDLPDNSIEQQTGSHTRGTRPSSRRRSI